MTTQLGGYEDDGLSKGSGRKDITVTTLADNKVGINTTALLVDATNTAIGPSNPLNISSTSNFTTIIEESGVNTYFGYAEIGSTTGSAVWRIKRINEDSVTTIAWADGVDTFTNTWDDRATYTYS